MIKDILKNSNIYESISVNLKKGFDWLKNTDLTVLEDGRYEIDGKNVYANVQTYETKTDAKYEAHRNYIDIQYMVKGEELVGVNDIAKCKTVDEYNPDTDLEFMNLQCQDDYQNLREGEFLVLFPTDAHKPSMANVEPKTVKKIVVKVRV